MTTDTLEKNEPDYLITYDGEYRVLDSDKIRDILASRPPSRRFNVGLGRLDNIVQGIEPGELIAIGGYTKHGKTLLCQTITRNLTEKGTKCLWFTFEVPMVQFLQQMPKEIKFYMPLKLEIHSMEWLLQRITEGALKYDTRVVFIDNLHHIIDIAKTRNPSLDIGDIIRNLKKMCMILEVTIFILCHSRKPEQFKGILPEVNEWDLRDSSFIPQESDSTWMIQRKMDKETKKYTDKCFVKVCNHRRTGAMGEIVNLIKVGQLLEEDVTCER